MSTVCNANITAVMRVYLYKYIVCLLFCIDGLGTSTLVIVAISTCLSLAPSGTGMTGAPTTPRSSPSAECETCRHIDEAASRWQRNCCDMTGTDKQVAAEVLRCRKLSLNLHRWLQSSVKSSISLQGEIMCYAATAQFVKPFFLHSLLSTEHFPSNLTF